ncbi:hypothetical protein, partial [Streptococcus sp. KCJ4932]|uniref:hypothetical protein n=1 Tax=Streptococcus sp. KCJ4932 TaxID=2545465 RepID=UPI0014044E62
NKNSGNNGTTIGIKKFRLIVFIVVVVLVYLKEHNLFNFADMAKFFSITVGIGVNALFDGVAKYEENDNLNKKYLELKIFFNTLYVAVCSSLLFKKPFLVLPVGLLIIFVYNSIKHWSEIKQCSVTSILTFFTFISIIFSFIIIFLFI